MPEKRNYGIDLLRMFSMFLVAVLHVNGQGGAMARISSAPGAYYATWLLETAAYCSTNCYGLISGFVGVDSRARLSRYLELWLQVFFYSAGISIIGWLLHPEWINGAGVGKAFLPAMFSTYWYFTAFTGVFFLQPYLNRLVGSLTERERKNLLNVIFLVFCVFTAVPRTVASDPMTLGGGYTFVWLTLLYLAGACLKKIRIRKRPGWQYLAGYALMTVISWGYKILMENYTRARLGEPRYGRLLTGYTAPTIFLCSIFLLLWFSSLQIRAGALTRIIRFWSPMAFSVYLIHVHPLPWEHLVKGAFGRLCYLPWYLVDLPVLGAALMIYILCSVLDLPRTALFRLLKVRSLCEGAEKKLKAIGGRNRYESETGE